MALPTTNQTLPETVLFLDNTKAFGTNIEAFGAMDGTLPHLLIVFWTAKLLSRLDTGVVILYRSSFDL